MGITLLTALIIQSNEIEVETFQGENDKYGFQFSRLENGYKYRDVATSQAVFDTQDMAKTAGDDLLKEIRALDLTKQ